MDEKQEPGLPEGWERRVSRSKGKAYYINRSTKRTTWEKPATSSEEVTTTPADVEKDGQIKAETSEAAASGEASDKNEDRGTKVEEGEDDAGRSQAAQNGADAGKEGDEEDRKRKRAKARKGLPKGWEARTSRSNGTIYYVNLNTKETIWEKPEASSEDGNTAPPEGDSDSERIRRKKDVARKKRRHGDRTENDDDDAAWVDMAADSGGEGGSEGESEDGENKRKKKRTKKEDLAETDEDHMAKRTAEKGSGGGSSLKRKLAHNQDEEEKEDAEGDDEEKLGETEKEKKEDAPLKDAGEESDSQELFSGNKKKKSEAKHVNFEADSVDPEWDREFGPFQIKPGREQWHYNITFTEAYARFLIRAASSPRRIITNWGNLRSLNGPLPMLSKDSVTRIITLYGRPASRAF